MIALLQVNAVERMPLVAPVLHAPAPAAQAVLQGFQSGEGALVHGAFTALETLQDGLRSRGWSVQDWGHQWHPLNSIDLQQSDQAHQCLQLLEALEALDDVRSVSCNLGEIPELESEGA